MLDVFLKNPTSKEMIDELEDKPMTQETARDIEDFLDHQYFTITEELAEEFVGKRLNIYKDYIFFRNKFPEFISDELRKLSEEDYEVRQNTKTVQKTIHDGIKIVEALADSDKKTTLKLMVLLELYRRNTKRMIDFIVQGVPRRVGVTSSRDKGATVISALKWREVYKETGVKPSGIDVVKLVNKELGPMSKPMRASEVSAYARSGFQQMIKQGRITQEEVEKMGIKLQIKQINEPILEEEEGEKQQSIESPSVLSSTDNDRLEQNEK